MKIKDVEIITIQDLIEPKRRRRRSQVLFGFLPKNTRDWKPQKSSKLYSDYFEKYKLFCNFSKRKGVVLLNQTATDILNLCNGERKIEDIFKNLSFTKRQEFKFSDAWSFGREGISFGEIYHKLRSGKEILTIDDLVKIIFLFKKKGLVYDFEKRKSISSQKFLNVHFYLTNESYFNCTFFNENLKEITQKEGFQAIDLLFDHALKNNFDAIFIKFFLEKPKELPLLQELIAYCKKKSMENYIDAKFSLFGNWSLITPSFIKNLRQMIIKLILPLDGIRKIYDKQTQFLKREGSFKEVEKALDILNKEKYPPFIVTSITALSLDGLKELTDYLLDKKLNFVFGFIQRHSLVPKELLLNQKKLTEVMFEVYKVIEKKFPRSFFFQNILGRNFPLLGEDWINKYNPFIIASAGVRQIDFKLKQKEKCSNCQFRELCLKSSPIITNYFSLENDTLIDYCEIYKDLIPQALKQEAKRLIKYRKS